MSPKHGLLLIDKPSGITSHDVVHRVRQTLGQRQVGHAGTLDPMASGLMILLLGDATKLSDYHRNGDKGYLVDVQLGVRTDTLDMDGEILSQEKVCFTEREIRQAIESLGGLLELPVPHFSAVKRGGKKLYEYARQGIQVERPYRPMEFFDLEILSLAADRCQVQMGCSKGSYVRSWVEALGQKLNTGAMVAGLSRSFSYPYALDRAISLDQLAEEFPSNDGGAYIPLSQCLPDWKAMTVGGKDLQLMSHGQISNKLKGRLIFEQKLATRRSEPIGIKVINGESGELLSILEAQPHKGLKIRRIFQGYGARA